MAIYRRKRSYRTIPPEQGKRFWWYCIRGCITLVGVSCILALIYYGTRIQAVQLETILVEGGETVDHEIIRGKVEDLLTGTYLLLIPKRFAFLYPHDRIVEVLSTIPRIHDVTVVRVSPQKLMVRFEEYMPHALLCNSQEGTEPCYFIDTTGYAFEEAPVLLGGTLVRHIQEDLTQIAVGRQIDETALARIDALSQRIETELFFRVREIHYKKNGDIEFYISGGGALYTTADADFDEAFTKIKTILGSKEFGHLEPGNFKYIDVRFDTKIFVNESMGTTSSTSTEAF